MLSDTATHRVSDFHGSLPHFDYDELKFARSFYLYRDGFTGFDRLERRLKLVDRADTGSIDRVNDVS
jgi:hypothetical protein